MRIRYHHLMCAPRFIGEGYSDAFCKNMRAVSEKMKSGDYTLVDTCDDICAACPNNKGGVCADEIKVKGYDKAVKNALADGKTPHPESICSDCHWYYICKTKETECIV